MDKIFEITTNTVKVSNLSFNEFKELFKNEATKIENFLKENFDNPEKISYLNFIIDHGTTTHPYGQTLYIDKGDEQYERSYNLLKKSPNFEKAIGYKIVVREQNPRSNERILSGLAFGEIEFLFDKETTEKFKKMDEYLAKDITEFYANCRTNFVGD